MLALAIAIPFALCFSMSIIGSSHARQLSENQQRWMRDERAKHEQAEATRVALRACDGWFTPECEQIRRSATQKPTKN